jgi:hypothetical protein
MPKIIVGPGEIAIDPKLALIKKFRVLNKRVGEYKQEIEIAEIINPDEVSALLEERKEAIKQLNILYVEAKRNGFNIWVNPNGKTGHNYPNDYKETDDNDNSDEAYQLVLQIAAQIQEEIRNRNEEGLLGLN